MLKRVKLSGFMSIREMDLELGPLNVLIGANGSGKSNLLTFFRMLRSIAEGELWLTLGRTGGAGALLHYGPGVTQAVRFLVAFESDEGNGQQALEYEAELWHAAPDGLMFGYERVTPNSSVEDSCDAQGHESILALMSVSPDDPAFHVQRCLKGVRSLHLADTSWTATVRRSGYVNDNHVLRPDAANLAAYLYMLRETRREYYERIVATIRLAAPFFGDFVLAPMELNPNNILLEWRERESDYPFGPHQLPDGLLRLMALVTLLQQPEDRLPSLIIIDEPELGLHPYALEIIASLLDAVSTHTQVLVATQSAPLVDMCAPETIVVVDRIEGRSEFRRLRPPDLAEWLAEYSLGELWEKNVIGGVPSR